MKRLLTIATVGVFLVSTGFGQWVEREIWTVEVLEDSAVADDTTFSQEDLLLPAIVSGILGYGALNPYRNFGTKTASYIGIVASSYLMVDYVTNAKDMTAKEALKEFGLFILHGAVLLAYANDISTDLNFKRQNSTTVRLADAYFAARVAFVAYTEYKKAKK